MVRNHITCNNTLPLETLQSAFPRCCGLCFYVKNKCFVVKLQRGILYPPKEYWKFCYNPIFDDDYDEYEDEDEDDEDEGTLFYLFNPIHCQGCLSPTPLLYIYVLF